MTQSRTARGWTLIELSVVLVLMALGVSAVSLTFSERYRSVTQADVEQRLVHIDHLARDHARRFGRQVELHFDLEESRVQRQMTSEDGVEFGLPVQLPRGFQIREVRVASAEESAANSVVQFAPSGMGPMYAIHLLAPNQQAQWLLFTAATGHAVRIEDDQSIEDIFQAIEPTGLDAD